MKIISIVGARPQFIKAAILSRTLREKYDELLIHTGQHYDHEMSQIFFEELKLPKPDVNLNIGSGSHGWQTGHMLIDIEEVLLAKKPDWVLVYGDTNSTLAGAMAAAKLGIKVAHVEAGLRSYNRNMPEELNRVTTDHLSDLLLCPSQVAVNNLATEGLKNGVHLVGDVMADALELAKKHVQVPPDVLSRLNLTDRNYLLMTVHRAENTDCTDRLSNILTALNGLDEPVIFPVHPRTQKAVKKLAYTPPPHVYLIEPVSYLTMIALAQSARLILTDSGGLQKEAYWLGVPCMTLRDETEWIETVQVGWNVVLGSNTEKIIRAVRTFKPPDEHPPLYGDGRASARCLALLSSS